MKEHIPKIDNEYLKEKRKAQLLKRRRMQRYGVIALLVIVVLIVGYMFSPLSQITSADIKGNRNVSTQSIEKALEIDDKPRNYTYNKGKIEQKLEKNKLIKSADINKHLFNGITVTIDEHDIVGVISEKNKIVPILDSGEVVSDFKGNLPSEAPYLDGFKASERKEMVETLSDMDPSIRTQISEIVYAPEKDQNRLIHLYMRDGVEVLGDMKTINDKLQYYPSMSQALEKDESGQLKEQGFIDLSVGATFIPYNNVNESSSNSASSQNVRKSSQSTDDAKEALKDSLNQIKEEEDKDQ